MKIPSFRAKAYLVFHGCLYNKLHYGIKLKKLIIIIIIILIMITIINNNNISCLENIIFD